MDLCSVLHKMAQHAEIIFHENDQPKTLTELIQCDAFLYYLIEQANKAYRYIFNEEIEITVTGMKIYVDSIAIMFIYDALLEVSIDKICNVTEVLQGSMSHATK